MPFAIRKVGNQREALRILADLVVKGSTDPKVVQAARAITMEAPARDDRAEVDLIFDAVKNGTPKVKGLDKGFRYVKDPRAADFYTGARAILDACERGAAAGDCDEHTVLVASLLAALGFMVGVRAYGPKGGKEYNHVYAVVSIPKDGPWPKGYSGHGVDTTVPEATTGWQPKTGRILTFWID